jgi:hypothetical protein
MQSENRYSVNPDQAPSAENFSVIMKHDDGHTETVISGLSKTDAEKRARRFNAIRAWAQLDGEERYCLMIKLDVENRPFREAHEACISHIMQALNSESDPCLAS